MFIVVLFNYFIEWYAFLIFFKSTLVDAIAAPADSVSITSLKINFSSIRPTKQRRALVGVKKKKKFCISTADWPAAVGYCRRRWHYRSTQMVLIIKKEESATQSGLSLWSVTETCGLPLGWGSRRRYWTARIRRSVTGSVDWIRSVECPAQTSNERRKKRKKTDREREREREKSKRKQGTR